MLKLANTQFQTNIYFRSIIGISGRSQEYFGGPSGVSRDLKCISRGFRGSQRGYQKVSGIFQRVSVCTWRPQGLSKGFHGISEDTRGFHEY